MFAVCRLQVRIHPSIHVTSKFARRYGKYYESEVHVNLDFRIISIILVVAVVGEHFLLHSAHISDILAGTFDCGIHSFN